MTSAPLPWRAAVAALLMLMTQTGCLIVIAESGDRQDRQDREDREDREAACLAQLPAALESSYLARTDCRGELEVAGYAISGMVYDDQAAQRSPHRALGAEVAVTQGEDFTQRVSFSSDCAGQQATLRMDIPMGLGEAASAHAHYRCDYALSQVGRPQRCQLTLADGKPIDGHSCQLTLHRAR